MKPNLSSTPAASAAGVEARSEKVGEEGVLNSLRAFRAEEVRREQAMVLLAVEWARLNPDEGHVLPDGSTPAFPPILDDMEAMWAELAERGCPHVDNLSIPAFADAAGMTEFQAGKLMREAILLVFMLPKVWERAAQGQLEVWRARKLAEDCWGLAPEAIAYIDRNMSLATARHTEGGREGIIAEAKLRYMPEQAKADQEAASEQRSVNVGWEEHPGTGVAEIWGALDLPDAADLEAALSTGAQAIKDLGSDAPLDVRRSWALGDLARASRTSDQPSPGDGDEGEGVFYHPDCACQRAGTALSLTGTSYKRPAWDGKVKASSKVQMYLHLTPEALIPSASSTAEFESDLVPVRVEGDGIPAGMVLTAQTVREWFNRPSTMPKSKVIFRPVIDLAEHHHVEAYEIPERIQEHVALRDGGCAFPWCHRKARHTDCDHTIPWKSDGSGGPTCTCNLAPLCRRHHRAKTHADNHTGSQYTWWRYEALGEGKYLWQGPNGTRLLRTNSGVYDITDQRLSNGPRTPDRRTPATTIDDVTTPAASSKPLNANVIAAQKTVTRIVASVPKSDTFADRYPPPNDEKPFVPPVRRRERSWRELAPQYDVEKGYIHLAKEPEPSKMNDLLDEYFAYATAVGLNAGKEPPF